MREELIEKLKKIIKNMDEDTIKEVLNYAKYLIVKDKNK
ncbi:hypothetical protein JWYL7_0542 [Alkalithermobacter thermoalcaliphilus JW-YL-7 = DSM 7308]|uniref:Uncharacterized protein n=1 Tax=Alkalithermobacter thermoalcaliphilus JW-YL-7 = DSM 7308 TaxID=1121328 RepID=A0A150FPF1_CLOPD|nr:hypothetical protein JWYL7_0542 [[Clostridium] paradoxum JW-YL-7 = DSM 7308]